MYNGYFFKQRMSSWMVRKPNFPIFFHANHTVTSRAAVVLRLRGALALYGDLPPTFHRCSSLIYHSSAHFAASISSIAFITYARRRAFPMALWQNCILFPLWTPLSALGTPSLTLSFFRRLHWYFVGGQRPCDRWLRFGVVSSWESRTCFRFLSFILIEIQKQLV